MQDICSVIKTLITAAMTTIVALGGIVLVICIILIFAGLMVLAGVLLIGTFLFVIVWEFFQGMGQWLKTKISD